MKENQIATNTNNPGLVKCVQILPGEEQWVGKALSDKIKAVTRFTPKKKQHIVVSSSKCVGCGTCHKYCLGGVFDIDETTGKSKVARLETCMECTLCVHICPQDAISFEYPEGGAGVELWLS